MSFQDSWDYSSGTTNQAPAAGAMYFRVPSETLRINKQSQTQDRTTEVEALKAGDLIQVGVEEYWQVRNIAISASYVTLEVADLQKGPSAATLSPGIYEFDVDTEADYKKPGNRPNAVEWDGLKAKMNGRTGMPPGWVDSVLNNRELPREEQLNKMKIALVRSQQ